MSKMRTWESDYRLPQTTLPLHYDLYLFPNLEDDTFSGHVAITVETKEPRNHFLVHVKYLDVRDTQLKAANGDIIPLEDAFEYAPNEFWVVVPANGPVPTGVYTLSMKFQGRLDRDILGFYRSTYVDDEGKPHKIATSKFQPTYARRVINFCRSFFRWTENFLSYGTIRFGGRKCGLLIFIDRELIE